MTNVPVHYAYVYNEDSTILLKRTNMPEISRWLAMAVIKYSGLNQAGQNRWSKGRSSIKGHKGSQISTTERICISSCDFIPLYQNTAKTQWFRPLSHFRFSSVTSTASTSSHWKDKHLSWASARRCIMDKGGGSQRADQEQSVTWPKKCWFSVFHLDAQKLVPGKTLQEKLE